MNGSWRPRTLARLAASVACLLCSGRVGHVAETSVVPSSRVVALDVPPEGETLVG